MALPSHQIDVRWLNERLAVTRDAWAAMTPEQQALVNEAREFATDYAIRSNDLATELDRVRSFRRALLLGAVLGTGNTLVVWGLATLVGGAA